MLSRFAARLAHSAGCATRRCVMSAVNKSRVAATCSPSWRTESISDSLNSFSMVAPVKVNGCVEAPLNHDGGLPPLSMVTPAAALLWGSLVGTATSAATGHRHFLLRTSTAMQGRKPWRDRPGFSSLSRRGGVKDSATALHGEVRSFSIPDRHQLQRAARRPAGPAPWPGTPDRAQPTRCMRRPPP